MTFGIKENNDGIFCANCNNRITSDTFFTQKYCSNCGAPLKKASADDYTNLIKREQLKVLQTISASLLKYDIQKILTDLKKELT